MKTVREDLVNSANGDLERSSFSAATRLNSRVVLPVLGLSALIWFLLTGADYASWLIGLPAVIAAGWSAIWLSGPRDRHLRPLGLVRFLPFFVWESICGGFDVVSRVMRPKMRIRPGFHPYRTRLVQPSARLLFVNSLSLLPGTLAADLDGDLVLVHALDVEADIDVDLVRLERAVAAVYGEAI